MKIEKVVDFSGTYCMVFNNLGTYEFVDVYFPEGFSFGISDFLLVPIFDGKLCYPIIPNVYSFESSYSEIHICLNSGNLRNLYELIDLFINSQFTASLSCIDYMIYLFDSFNQQNLSSRKRFGKRFRKFKREVETTYNERCDWIYSCQMIFGKMVEDIKLHKEVMILKLPYNV